MLINNRESKIVIVGLNDISVSLAASLASIYEVHIIYYEDQSKNKLWQNLDITTREIDSNIAKTLEEFELNNIKSFIALTNDDEFNLFSSWLAKRSAINNTIAMVNDSSYQKIELNNNIITFNPFQLIMNIILSEIEETDWLQIESCLPGDLYLVETKVTRRNLNQLISSSGHNLELVALKKENSIKLNFSDNELKTGFSLYFLARKSFINNKKIYKYNLFKRRMIILGGNVLGEKIALFFNKLFQPIIIIEPELNKCEMLAARLNDPLIIQGEGIDLDLLKSEGVKENSVFIAASSNDFHNILSTHSAVKLGCQKDFTILNNRSNYPISNLLNLNNIISTSELIASYLKSIINLDLKNGIPLLNNQLFAFLIEVRPSMNIINKDIDNVFDDQSAKKIKIGAIVRENNLLLPSEIKKIKKCDQFIVISPSRRVDLKIFT